MAQANSIEILGVPYSPLSTREALTQAEQLYEREESSMIAIVNSHGLNLATRDGSYRAALRGADLILNDGKGVMLAARIQRRKFPEDLNGNHFGPLLIQRASQRGWPVFFLGARPGVAERAAERLRKAFAGLDVVGVRDGYFSESDEPAVVQDIRRARTGLLVVALGNPRQELWLDRYLADTGARLGIGIGAMLDFWAGEIPRAPRWLNRLGLEWVYRLIKEPRRLWRRYLLGHPVFLYRVLMDRVFE